MWWDVLIAKGILLQTLIVIAWVGANLALFVVNYEDTRWWNIGLALGHVANLNLGIVLLPVARNSVWTFLLRMPFEKALRLHRVCYSCLGT